MMTQQEIRRNTTRPAMRRVAMLRTYVLACERGYLAADGRHLTARERLAMRFEDLEGARNYLRSTRVPRGDWRIQTLDEAVEH